MSLAERFHEMFKNNNLKITMSQLVEITGVSPSQIRYWEKKGYIKSEQGEKNKNHLYPISILYRVTTIKYFLDQGYTLAVAVKKEEAQRQEIKLFREFFFNQKLSIEQHNAGKCKIKLGKVAEDPNIEVYATVENGKTELHIRKSK